MKKLFIGFTVIAMSALLAGCPQSSSKSGDETASAKTGGDGEGTGINAIVQQASGGQFHVVSTFDGPSGFQGVVVADANGSNKQIGWASEDGQVFTPGPLFGPNGKNFSKEAMEEHAGYVKPQDVADTIKAKDLGFIAKASKVKKDAPTVTVFFEPYCTFCHKLFFDLKPKIDAGDIKMRVILVSFLRPDSAERAADIEHASNPYKALTAWENNLNSDETLKKPYPASKATDEQKQVIASNSKLMNDMGQNGTPALIFCTKDTKEVKIQGGYQPNTAEFLGSIGNEGHAICE